MIKTPVLKEARGDNTSGIEEVNTFTNQGAVIHFSSPKVQASQAANTCMVTSSAETQRRTEALPNTPTSMERRPACFTGTG